MSEISIADSLTVLVTDTLKLRVTGVVGAIGTLVVAPGVIHVPEQSLQDFECSLTDKLVALPDCLRCVLIHQGEGVVVLRPCSHRPCTVSILDGIRRGIIVHGIKHRCTLIACRNTEMLAIHHICTHR